MTVKEFFSFKHNTLLWGNLIGMVVVAGLLVWAVLMGLDSYTHHGEAVKVLPLRELRETEVDMFTTVFIGNSQTKVIDRKMVTPRGYRNV